MDLARLRATGAAVRAAAPPVEREFLEVRARFHPGLAVHLERVDRYEARSGRVPVRKVNGQAAHHAPYCGDCGAVRSPLAHEPCRACGSAQPPNLSRLPPRARHIIGEAPLR